MTDTLYATAAHEQHITADQRQIHDESRRQELRRDCPRVWRVSAAGARISYHATIQPDRSILATTTLRYTNDADRQNLPRQNGKPFYSDFVRLYVPAGSTLLATSGLDERWPTYPVHNKTQFSGYFTLPSHRSRTLTFRYRVPANVDPGRSYHLLIQKQPGTTATPLQITVSTARGVHLGKSGVRLTTALSGDVTLRGQ